SPEVAEYAAFMGALPALLLPLPDPGEVLIDGIALPFVNQIDQPASTQPVPSGVSLDSLGDWIVTAQSSPGPAPEGYLVAAKAGPQGGLTADEVTRIIDQSMTVANQTRGIIRLPLA